MRRYAFGPLYCLIHFSSSVWLGLNDHGTKAVKPPSSSCRPRIASKWSRMSSASSTWPYIIVAVDLNPRRCASRCPSSHASGPPFFGSTRVRTRPDQPLGAAAGQRALARVLQAIEDVGEGEAAHLRDRLDLRRREEVRRHLREAPERLAHDRQVVVERQRGVV